MSTFSIYTSYAEKYGRNLEIISFLSIEKH
jgi:hypothetical protein